METKSQSFEIEGKSITVYPSEGPLVIFHSLGKETLSMIDESEKEGFPSYSLALIDGADWDKEFSPWPAPAVFKNGGCFPGGGDAYLSTLLDRILPAILSKLPSVPKQIGIVGYSLAGLFSLYALAKSDVFSFGASVSGSLWYPGAEEYFKAHPLSKNTRYVYLSLGDKEKATKNPVLQTVEEKTLAIKKILDAQGKETTYVSNPGNHYNEPIVRSIKAIKWLLEKEKGSPK